jgi:hypothetical protein
MKPIDPADPCWSCETACTGHLCPNWEVPAAAPVAPFSPFDRNGLLKESRIRRAWD